MADDLKRRPVLGVRLGGLAEAAPAVEAVAFDFVALGDPDDVGEGPIGSDPLSVAAYLMTTTRRLGLVATVPATWAPFNVARALASFDHLSQGRVGWRPVAGEPAPDPERLAEHRAVVLELFDSWDDEALVFDKASSVFADRTRVRRIRHDGRHFTVDGPLNAPRPVQGRPVTFDRLADAGPTTDVALAPIAAWEARPDTRAPLRLAEVPPGLGGRAGAEALADRLEAAFRLGLCDGALLPALDGLDLALATETLAPRLMAGPPRAGSTFRERLGLPRPANRLALEATA